jgi:antitoxin component HigA of HigAB toxin-antitoxin module
LATGVEKLGYLIETHGVKQGDVAAGTGLADSTVSEILTRKRKIERQAHREPGALLQG